MERPTRLKERCSYCGTKLIEAKDLKGISVPEGQKATHCPGCNRIEIKGEVKSGD